MCDPICPENKLKIFDLFIVLHIFVHTLKVWDRICSAYNFITYLSHVEGSSGKPKWLGTS
jgi:hypothetical protein